jgi:hypothetical protein
VYLERLPPGVSALAGYTVQQTTTKHHHSRRTGGCSYNLQQGQTFSLSWLLLLWWWWWWWWWWWYLQWQAEQTNRTTTKPDLCYPCCRSPSGSQSRMRSSWCASSPRPSSSWPPARHHHTVSRSPAPAPNQLPVRSDDEVKKGQRTRRLTHGNALVVCLFASAIVQLASGPSPPQGESILTQKTSK